MKRSGYEECRHGRAVHLNHQSAIVLRARPRHAKLNKDPSPSLRYMTGLNVKVPPNQLKPCYQEFWRHTGAKKNTSG
jgi:hypothetical protein